MKNKKGQAVVEMSLVLPIFLLVVVGIFDFGRALHCWSSLNHQCVQAARAASKRTNQLVARNIFTSTTHTSLKEVKKVFWESRSPIMATTDYTEPDWIASGVASSRDSVTISASFHLTLMTPFLGNLLSSSDDDPDKSGALTISASATEKKE